MVNVPKSGQSEVTHAGELSLAPAGVAPARSYASAPADSRELVRRAQAGDREAFEQLLLSHQQRVFAVVGSILRRREDIEDVVQQVFIKVYVSLKRFDCRSSFSTWLYKVTVNECYDYLRKKRVRRLVYEGDLSEDQVRQFEMLECGAAGSHTTAPPDIGHRVELREVVERLLDELGEQDRMMLVLKEVHGFSVEEIGEILDLNVNTVKVRLFRARGRLVEVYRRRLQGRRRGR
jgi:RNA polymerase sigma-70 factor (ECF subfamily)